MINFISVFRKSVFVQNVSTLSSGIIVAHLISILTSLVLTRLYSPQDIGYLTFFSSLSILLANIFTLGYELAIVPPKKEKQALKLVHGTFYLLLTLSSFLFILLLSINITGLQLDLGIPSSWLLYLPISILFLGCINIALEWFNRIQNYKVLSFTKILQSSFTAFPQIIIGYLFLNKIGLVLGFIFGRFIAVLMFVRNFFLQHSKITFSLTDIKATLIEYKKYPKYVSSTLILDRLSMEAPYFLIAFFFSESILGYFAISYRVLSVPLSFLGSSIGQVFFKFLASKSNTKQNLTPYLIKTWFYLAIIGVIPMGIILIGGAPLFSFVFGDQWGFSGTLAILLIPMLYLDFISSPTGRSFLILQLEHYTPYFSAARLIYMTGSLYIGFLYNNVALGIILLSLTRTLGLLIQNIILYIKAKQHDSLYQ